MYHVEKREVRQLNGSFNKNGTQKASKLKAAGALM